jgi:hypothetical protein
MGNRRMFSQTIIDSDSFLDMPLSTQALYFHLSMRADDEGFINNPKKIIRMTGASNDEFKVLVAKQFLIPFDSGVVVIKHWKIHNLIRKDRFKPTFHKLEKEQLYINENVYFLENNREYCQPDDNHLTPIGMTQGKLSKDKLSKGKLSNKNNCDNITLQTIKEDIKEFDSIESKKVSQKIQINFEEIKNTFNSICLHLPKINSITPKRKKTITSWLKEEPDLNILAFFKKVNESDFLNGLKADWRADFDWIIKPENRVKIIEGNYNNIKSKNNNTNKYKPSNLINDDDDYDYSKNNYGF